VVIEHQNHDKAVLAITSVTGSVDGALTANTDYFKGQNENLDTCITLIDSATLTTESQSITIVYDYTPAASKKLSSGGKKTIAPKVVRLTNTDENGRSSR